VARWKWIWLLIFMPSSLPVSVCSRSNEGSVSLLLGFRTLTSTPVRIGPFTCFQQHSSNQRVERTAPERFGFDAKDFMTIIGHGLSALTAAVAHPCRSVSLTRPPDFQRRTTENRTRRSASERFWMPTSDVTEGSARSASKVAGSGIRTGRTGASGGRISSPPMIITDLISERTR